MKALRFVFLVFVLTWWFGCSSGREIAQPGGKSLPGGLAPKPSAEISSDELVTLVLDVRYANGDLVRDSNLVVLIDRRPRDRLRIGTDGKVTVTNLQMGMCQVIVRDLKAGENLKLQQCFLDSPVNNALVQIPIAERVDPGQAGVQQDSLRAIKKGKVKLD
jgi:hypothetical protein